MKWRAGQEKYATMWQSGIKREGIKKQGRNDPASCGGAEVALLNMGRESLNFNFFCVVLDSSSILFI